MTYLTRKIPFAQATDVHKRPTLAGHNFDYINMKIRGPAKFPGPAGESSECANVTAPPKKPSRRSVAKMSVSKALALGKSSVQHSSPQG